MIKTARILIAALGLSTSHLHEYSPDSNTTTLSKVIIPSEPNKKCERRRENDNIQFLIINYKEPAAVKIYISKIKARFRTQDPFKQRRKCLYSNSRPQRYRNRGS